MPDPRTITAPDAQPDVGHETTATAGTGDGASASSVTAEYPQPDSPFPQIPRYSIVRQIGRGGMGVVYEAVGPLGVRVALKVIHPTKRRPVLMARFQQEARAMMDLDHPNLIRIYDYDEHDGWPYFTMKLLPGRTLSDLLPDLWRDPRAAIQLAARVAEAVGFVHSRKKVHRDLKPNNVLLDDQDNPIVSDFGLIKETGELDLADPTGGPTPSPGYSSTLTHTGDRIGTIAYMAPEQAIGDLARIGPSTDVWALGVMIHEMVWGKRPKFTEANAVDFIDWPGDGLEPELVTRLRPIISRCLAHHPEGRFANAAELRQELETLLALGRESTPARPARKFVLAAAIALLIVGVIGTVWWAIGPRGKDPVPEPPRDPLAELQTELSEKGKVDLLDEKSRWRWNEWMTGDAEWIPDQDPQVRGGHFVAPPKSTRLLEIARDLSVSGYRLTLQIRHVGPEGEVGVYVGRSQQTSTRGPCHCMVALAIQDYADDRPQVPRRLLRHVAARSCPTDNAAGFFDAPRIDERIDTGQPGRWLEVAITLTPTEFLVVLDGREFKKQSRNQLLAGARQLGFARKGFEGLIPTFKPSEGLGIFSYSGAIEVRSAQISNH